MSLISANSARKDAKKAAKPQTAIANEQLGMMRQAQPYYGNILQFLAQNAGLALPGTTSNQASGASPSATAPIPGLPTGLGGIQNSALGVYGQNPADVFRLRAAEDDITKQAQGGSNQLRYMLGRQGAGENTIAAALARNESERVNSLEGFRRSLAINSGSEQERRIGALLAALGTGLGAGQAAAGTFGNQAQLAAGQSAAAGGAIGDFIQQMMLAQILRRQQQPRDPFGVLGGGGWDSGLPGGRR